MHAPVTAALCVGPGCVKAAKNGGPFCSMRCLDAKERATWPGGRVIGRPILRDQNGVGRRMTKTEFATISQAFKEELQRIHKEKPQDVEALGPRPVD